MEKNENNNIELVLEVLQFYFTRLERIGNTNTNKVKVKKEGSS